MARVRAGDHAAFEKIYRLHAARVFGYLWRLTRDETLADELRQDAFFRLWRARDGWKPGGSVSAYLITTARNLALNSFRDQRARQRRETVLAGFAASASPSPEALKDRSELAGRVNAAIAALPDRPREVFSLKRDAGMSYQEIADLLGISPKTVGIHMGRAFRLLREALADVLE